MLQNKNIKKCPHFNNHMHLSNSWFSATEGKKLFKKVGLFTKSADSIEDQFNIATLIEFENKDSFVLCIFSLLHFCCKTCKIPGISGQSSLIERCFRLVWSVWAVSPPQHISDVGFHDSPLQQWAFLNRHEKIPIRCSPHLLLLWKYSCPSESSKQKTGRKKMQSVTSCCVHKARRF